MTSIAQSGGRSEAFQRNMISASVMMATTVVIIEMESSPPARLVHTEAEANVLGTIAVTNNPPNNSSVNK